MDGRMGWTGAVDQRTSMAPPWGLGFPQHGPLRSKRARQQWPVVWEDRPGIGLISPLPLSERHWRKQHTPSPTAFSVKCWLHSLYRIPWDFSFGIMPRIGFVKPVLLSSFWQELVQFLFSLSRWLLGGSDPNWGVGNYAEPSIWNFCSISFASVRISQISVLLVYCMNFLL